MGEETSGVHCPEGFARDRGYDHGGSGSATCRPVLAPAIVTWLPRYGTTPIDWYGYRFRWVRRNVHLQKVCSHVRRRNLMRIKAHQPVSIRFATFFAEADVPLQKPP